MKRTVSIFLMTALAAGLAITASAKRERKEEPKTREVLEKLKELGGEHYPEEGMKVKKVTNIQIGDTYFHIFEGKLDTVGYHVIIYDNYLNYLGFYKSAYPPTNYQIPGSIVIDPSDVDENGDPLYFPIPLDPVKGPPSKVQLGGIPTQLIPGPEVEKPEAAGGGAGGETAEGEGPTGPEFREWTITHEGQEYKPRAIYVDHTFSEVILMGETTGKTKAFPITSISKDDREYIKQFK